MNINTANEQIAGSIRGDALLEQLRKIEYYLIEYYSI